MAKYNKVVTENRKARFDFEIFETFEAGISLKGTEVKSLRLGRANLKDSFARVDKGEVYLHGMHISPYGFEGVASVSPNRTRKLLLKKAEIRKLIGKTAEKGLSLIPLKVYFTGNYAKVLLGTAKGKRIFSKKDSIKERDLDRDMERELNYRER